MLDLATRRRMVVVALVLVLLFGLPVGPARAGRAGLRLVRGQRPARQPERRAVPPTRWARHAVRPGGGHRAASPSGRGRRASAG